MGLCGIDEREIHGGKGGKGEKRVGRFDGRFLLVDGFLGMLSRESVHRAGGSRTLSLCV